MKALCMLLCVGVSACHGYSWGSCFGDFSVSNVCVTTNGFSVDPDRLQGIIENTYNEAVAFAGHEKRMDRFLNSMIVYLSFEPNGNEQLQYWNAEGLTYERYNKSVTGPMGDHVVGITVLVKYWPELYDECLESSATAHEFVHVGSYATKGMEWFNNSQMHPDGWFNGEGTVEDRSWRDYADQMCPEEEP